MDLTTIKIQRENEKCIFDSIEKSINPFKQIISINKNFSNLQNDKTFPLFVDNLIKNQRKEKIEDQFLYFDNVKNFILKEELFPQYNPNDKYERSLQDKKNKINFILENYITINSGQKGKTFNINSSLFNSSNKNELLENSKTNGKQFDGDFSIRCNSPSQMTQNSNLSLNLLNNKNNYHINNFKNNNCNYVLTSSCILNSECKEEAIKDIKIPDYNKNINFLFTNDDSYNKEISANNSKINSGNNYCNTLEYEKEEVLLNAKLYYNRSKRNKNMRNSLKLNESNISSLKNNMNNIKKDSSSEKSTWKSKSKLNRSNQTSSSNYNAFRLLTSKKKRLDNGNSDRFLAQKVNNILIDEKFELLKESSKTNFTSQNINFEMSNIPFTISNESNINYLVSLQGFNHNIINLNDKSKSHSIYLNILKSEIIDEKGANIKKLESEYKRNLNSNIFSFKNKSENDDADLNGASSVEKLLTSNGLNLNYQRNKSISKNHQLGSKNSIIDKSIKEEYSKNRKLKFTSEVKKKRKTEVSNNKNNKFDNFQGESELDFCRSNKIKTKKVKALCEYYFPDIIDNFYLNCLDMYSNKKIALATKGYLHIIDPQLKLDSLDKEFQTNLGEKFNYHHLDNQKECYELILKDKSIFPIKDLKEITSLKFQEDNKLILWNKAKYLQKFDLEKGLLYEIFSSSKYFPTMQINTIETYSENIIFLGSEKSYVFFHDLRENTSPKILYNHKNENEVCKIRYSSKNNFLISGGNDNKIIIYDIRKSQIVNDFSSLDCPAEKEIYNANNSHHFNHKNTNLGNFTSQDLNNRFMHKAAVKGLDYNEAEDLIASGGGTHDKTIKIWDMKRLCFVDQIVTDSQISNISFINNDSFLVSCGYNGINTVNYKFDYIKMKESHLLNSERFNTLLEKNCVFEKHKKRVLFMAKSMKDNHFSTCSSDGILKFFSYESVKEKREFCDNGNINYSVRI